jgi:hypothetical protein
MFFVAVDHDHASRTHTQPEHWCTVPIGFLSPERLTELIAQELSPTLSDRRL